MVAEGGLEVCSSPAFARFGMFCLENPLMSLSPMSVTVTVFPYYVVSPTILGKNIFGSQN